MHLELRINSQSSEPYIDIALDTIAADKQALIFVSTKPSAEKTAEDIAKKIKEPTQKELADKILNSLAKPTKQCIRLAKCVEKGIAFHHAGLHSKQKELIEDAFRQGSIKIIACTPTLSAGLDLPAFRTVLREVKRYTQTGYNWIPVLEYHQMAGRAGRPGKEEYGECIILANNELQRDELIDRYINGLPEEIFSKLAVEPVLRTYILSLISTGFVRTKQDIIAFFSKTFWAHQFKEMDALTAIIEKMLHLLSEFDFIQSAAHTADFTSANEKVDETYEPTLLGKRAAELYIDPLTANYIIACLRRRDHYADIALLQMVSHTLEMRPLVSVKLKEFEAYQEEAMRFDKDWLEPEPAVYDDYYDEYLDSVKTALFFYDWINEVDEDFILEKYNVRPGEVHVKLELADWLLYASAELAGLSNLKDAVKDINRLRFRLSHGIKEELIPLCRLKGISRIRARKLFSNGIKDLGDMKKADVQKLGQLLGPKLALDIKSQVGQEFAPEKVEISEYKRKGQMSLGKY